MPAVSLFPPLRTRLPEVPAPPPKNGLVKTFQLLSEPPKVEVQNSRLYNAKIHSGKALICFSQVFSLPSIFAIAIVVIPAVFISKVRHNYPLQITAEVLTDNIREVSGRFMNYIPMTWIAMGFAYLGEASIVSSGAFKTNNHAVLDRLQEFIYLILANDTPLSKVEVAPRPPEPDPQLRAWYDIDEDNASVSNKTARLVSVPPYRINHSEKHMGLSSTTVNIATGGEIPFKVIVRKKYQQIPEELKNYPKIVRALNNRGLPYRGKDYPICHVTRDIFGQKAVLPQSLLIIDISDNTPEQLDEETYAGLAWQIAVAELRAVNETLKDSEIMYKDRYLLQQLSIETTPEQRFIRAALFYVESVIQDMPIAISPDSPIEYHYALDYVEETLLPALKAGATRAEIITLLANQPPYIE